MRNGIFGAIGAAALMAGAGAALAQPLDSRTAKAQLFGVRGVTVEMLPVQGVSAEDAGLLRQVAESYAYHAAVAIAPDEELLKSEATMLVANQHSTEAASKVALDRCNAARKGGRACEIVALVRPAKWESRAFTLSVEATAALDKDYGRRGTRAMAISPATGAWALGQGDNAQRVAINACAAKGGNDCTIAVAD
ncbi:5-aminolevulic acid synthase [Szabonella alba]|uniref:5-aminolevulic acid synthase n=1 Tax=Szabonella alba TaxID=2804194 RepID=A0A8K0Y174_9RHOB|nr:5-aminolevulic acid synthase [Szabonella alba]MBL4917853.1 5-aminolevulic acid synthase [Szabonella alba]